MSHRPVGGRGYPDLVGMIDYANGRYTSKARVAVACTFGLLAVLFLIAFFPATPLQYEWSLERCSLFAPYSPYERRSRSSSKSNRIGSRSNASIEPKGSRTAISTEPTLSRASSC
jgi:hypothetical protein